MSVPAAGDAGAGGACPLSAVTSAARPTDSDSDSDSDLYSRHNRPNHPPDGGFDSIPSLQHDIAAVTVEDEIRIVEAAIKKAQEEIESYDTQDKRWDLASQTLIQMREKKNLLLQKVLEEQQLAAQRHRYHDFPIHTLDVLHRSVGRLLTRDPSAPASAPFSFAAQCVCVSPRVLLTAKHACFDGAKPMQIKVLFIEPLSLSQAAHGGHRGGALHDVEVVLLRHSGQMNIAVLGVVAEHNPFQPIPIAQTDTVQPLQVCALAAFGLARDRAQIKNMRLQRQARSPLTPSIVAQLPHVPQLFHNYVCGVDPMIRYSPSGAVTGTCVVGRSCYSNEKGAFGGAVIGVDQQTGGVVLMGIHVYNEYTNIDIRMELAPAGNNSIDHVDRHESRSSSSESAFSVGDSDEEDTYIQPEDAIASISHGSLSLSKSRPAGVHRKRYTLASRAAGTRHLAASGAPSRGVFVMAQSVLAARPHWSLQELEAQVAAHRSRQAIASSMAAHVPAAGPVASQQPTFTLRRSRSARRPPSQASASAPSFTVQPQRQMVLYDQET